MPRASDITNYQATWDAFYTNADYHETGSITKARAFRTAVIRLIGFRPSMAQHGESGGERTQYDLKTLQEMQREVKEFIAGYNTAGNSIVYAEFCRE